MGRQSDMTNDTPKNQPEFGDSFGKCGSTAHWEYDANNNTFLISGEGAIENFENINDYQNVKEFIDVFEKLNPESQHTIKDLMKNMK